MLQHYFATWAEDKAFREKCRQVQIETQIDSLLGMALRAEKTNPELSERLFSKAIVLELTR